CVFAALSVWQLPQFALKSVRFAALLGLVAAPPVEAMTRAVAHSRAGAKSKTEISFLRELVMSPLIAIPGEYMVWTLVQFVRGSALPRSAFESRDDAPAMPASTDDGAWRVTSPIHRG